MSAQSTSGDGVSVMGLLGLLFVTLKLTGFIAWSWWWVTCPFWASIAVASAIYIVAFSWIAILVVRDYLRSGRKWK